MAYTTIDKSSDYFNTLLYTGNKTASTTISGVGFQSDFTWIKSRTTAENQHAFDAVRGGGNRLYPNLANAQGYVATTLTSWTSDGFVTGTDDGTNANGENFVAWNWKMGTTSVPSGGSITPSAVSINTTAKQGIYKYTGNGTLGQTIAHGLGQAPKFIMVKNAGGSYDWACYHANIDNDLTQAGDYFLRLNTTAARDNNSGYFNDTITTDTVITLGSDNPVNHSGNEMIMYAFCDVQGYSKMGSYVGNGNADGPFLYCGFKPAYIMIKASSISGNEWNIWDNKRNPSNVAEKVLWANTSNTEAEVAYDYDIDMLSNGFKAKTADARLNQSGAKYMYMAFAEAPLVGSNNVPATAR